MTLLFVRLNRDHMASVKVAPKTPFAFENSTSSPRDDSFSTYLALVRESFPPEIGSPTPESLSCQVILNRRRTADGEIEIFDAEKYFSGVMDGDAPPAPENGLGTPSKKEVKVRVRSRSRAGSTSSETSCNSRSQLLRDSRKHPIPCGQRDANGKRFLSVFPCPCSRKNATDVDKEALSDARSDNLKKQLVQHGERCGGDDHLVSELTLKRISPGLIKQEVFAFPPCLSSVAGEVTVGKEVKEEEQVGRGPKVVVGQRRSFTMLTSSKIVVGDEGGRDDDVRSEASSDLFEIESLSMTSHPFISHGGTESAPSEASIEWSVVTASVANFSIASESEDQMASLRRPRRASGSGLLLGCVSDKAVNVTAGTAKMPERISFDRRDSAGVDGSVTAAARYRAESCGVDLGFGRAGRVLPPTSFVSGRPSQD